MRGVGAENRQTIERVGRGWSQRRRVIATMFGWMMVLGLAACGGGENATGEESATSWASTTPGPATTAAPDTTDIAAPVTTVLAAAEHSTTSTTIRHDPAIDAAMEEAEAQAASALAEAAALSVEVIEYPALSPAPSATTFKDYARSAFVATSRDPVSTFSLDTDRTSFQLALNWARSGYRIDPASVRAEEWINAFDYGYEHPIHQDSFAIVTDLVTHPLHEDLHLARIGFQAPELYDDRPLNVTLVLDASGSMEEGDRVAIARTAAESIRRGLRDRDRIAVVHFTSGVIDELTVDHRRPDDRAVADSIARLAPHESTNVQAGLDLGVQLADRLRRERPDAYNYIILMSDGVANVNATDPFAMLDSAHDPDAGNPLRLITIGVGISNYNDYLLEQLAQHGNGWYRYLSDTDQARSTFNRANWLALSVPFADQTRAQVTWNDRVVESWRMIGYENRVTSDESFMEDRKEFAEIPAGAATTVFYEIRLRDPSRRDLSRVMELADVELRWVTPVSGVSIRQAATMHSRPDVDVESADALLQFGAVVALTSDRYSALPDADADPGWVAADIRALRERLQALEGELGKLDSFRDFAFLLDHMSADLPRQPSARSGYSR